MKTLYLVDGHAQIFRAYYAPFGGTLTAPSGEPTKATYVFTQVLLNILRDRRPDYLAVAMDHDDATTERRAVYTEYKATRDLAPEDLAPQIRRIEEILEAMKVPTFQVPGHEADDIIATIAERLAGSDVETWVVSRDKDLYQILSDRVKLWDPQKDEVIDPAALQAKLGFTPEQAVEIQTLTGDRTDNVPGVPGIGPKRAAVLIEKYGSVEGILEHLDELPPNQREKLKAHGDTFALSRRLVTLARDLELEFDLEACEVSRISPEGARPIFEELGFRRLLEVLDGLQPPSRGAGTSSPGAGGASQVRGTARLVNTPAAFETFLGELRKARRFALDTETTSLRPMDCELVGLSFAWSGSEGWYVPVRSSAGAALDPEATLAALKPILEDPAVEKCGQNLKYDQVVLRSAGIDLQGVVFDSMVASFVLDPERRSHGLDALARELLGYQKIPITELIGKGRTELSMLDVGLDRLCEYACEDAYITWRLHEELAGRLEETGLERLFREVEMPLVGVLADMEFQGVTLDCERLETIKGGLRTRIERLREEIHRAAGRPFTIDSPKQLAEVLFDEQGLRVVKGTKTGRSTDASVLQTLAAETAHPLPGLVLQYRELTKLLGTYVEPLPGLISPRTGRIHASFHQAVASTGRLSSSDPNLQNIPIRTEEGREVRRAFVPSAPDRVLITADYSQIELRILAHLSKDKALLEAFRTDQDIHSFVAAQISGVEPGQVSREERRRAKAVNFGIIYGQGPFGLARTLGISRAQASEFIHRYRERYSGITRFMNECIAEAESKGYVSTMLGRRRPIPEIRSRNRGLRAQAERLAINTVIQGSAADMIKVAMVRIHRRVAEERLELDLLIQVHDELVFEGPRDQAGEYLETIREEMVRALPLDVPVRVDAAWGDNWLEGKE